MSRTDYQPEVTGFSQQQWLLLVLAMVLGVVTVFTLDKAGLTPHHHATLTSAVQAETAPLNDVMTDSEGE
ncbi:MAG: hypothetical protein ACRC46_09580 [Thermoguttaceae bacterium]